MKWIVLLVSIVLLAVVLCIYLFGQGQRKTYIYQKTGAAFKNPMMGFAPTADYEEAVGDNTLVYVGLTWRELEPEEGVFAFAKIEDDYDLKRWREEGKKVVFRFLCDVPRDEKHMDIPEWLYEKTSDGVFYDCSYGKGYSPNYDNQIFIEYHAKAIAALGEYFGKDHFFCYIELGSLGHWGEWHVNYSAGIPRFPSEEVCRQYVEPYVTAFPNAKLLMRRPFSFVTEYGMGVFNDMTGEPEATEEWLGWIYNGGVYSSASKPIELFPCEEVWNHAPVGGEFTSSLSMEEMLITKQAQTIELLRESHMIFAGPMCPIANEEETEYPQAVTEILKNIGYRYGVTKATMAQNKFLGTMKVSLELKNYGVTPMYFKWPVCLYLLDAQGQILQRFETDIDLTKITADATKKVQVKFVDEYIKDADAIVAIGIENPETDIPEVYLDMNTESQNKMYFLNVD